MTSSNSLGSHGASTETLDRGARILDSIAAYGVVKEETPQDEREILVQMEAHGGLCEVKYYTVCTYSATVQELKKKMEAIRSAKDCLDGLINSC